MRKFSIFTVVCVVVSFSAYAFSYMPDTWSTCMDDTAQFQDGTSAPAGGNCNDVGSGIVDGVVVNMLQCQSQAGNSPLDGGSCTGNSVQPIPVLAP